MASLLFSTLSLSFSTSSSSVKADDDVGVVLPADVDDVGVVLPVVDDVGVALPDADGVGLTLPDEDDVCVALPDADGAGLALPDAVDGVIESGGENDSWSFVTAASPVRSSPSSSCNDSVKKTH